MIDVTNFMPETWLYEGLKALGKVPRWFDYFPGPDLGDGLPRTAAEIHWDVLAEAEAKNPALSIAVKAIRVAWEQLNSLGHVLEMEAKARLLTDGPKLFAPNAEQWEAMEHVELRMPVGQFRSPYPALVVRIPAACRARLIREFGVDPDRAPTCGLIRVHADPGRPVLVCAVFQFKTTTQNFFFQDRPENPTVEVAINRFGTVEATEPGVDHDAEWKFAIIAVRACLNMCLLLSHYGHREGGPADPAAWAKHRKRKDLKHLACRDFSTVHMQQEITVRGKASVPTGNPPGDGTGIELHPHWRIGHWRAYPGHGAERAAGVSVPLLFVRPCLVRADRADGDLAESSATYLG